jgi:hypothetical protein
VSKVQVVVKHPLLSRPITMEIDRDFLTLAQSGYNPAAQTALAIQIKNAYNEHYGQTVSFLPWSGTMIEETEKSKDQPRGCALDDCCAGCDQGYHCHRQDHGCYM